VEPLLKEIREYFNDNPKIGEEWVRYFDESKEIKARTGCRASQKGKTIIDVWNELETGEEDHGAQRVRGKMSMETLKRVRRTVVIGSAWLASVSLFLAFNPARLGFWQSAATALASGVIAVGAVALTWVNARI
jgi:hypothetical protein